MGVAGLPLALSKVAIAYASGYLLERWCPPKVSELLRSQAIGYWDSPAAMWLTLGLVGTLGALAVFIFRPLITRGTVFEAAPRRL
jgi:hypothetical protein